MRVLLLGLGVLALLRRRRRTDDHRTEDVRPPMSLESSSWKEAAEPLIAQAQRAWDAERENAERLQKQRAGWLAALAALFGLGLFQVDWIRSPDAVSALRPPAMVIVVKALLTAGVLAFGSAFVNLTQLSVAVRSKPGRVIGSLGLIGVGAAGIALSVIGGPPSTAVLIVAVLVFAAGVAVVVGVRPDVDDPGFSSRRLHVDAEISEDDSLTADTAARMVFVSLATAAADLRDQNAVAAERLRSAGGRFTLGIVLVGLAVLCHAWSSIL